ncbi:MAG: hypothetical protein HC809_17310 [Gammaproteobacteria bacterium]|nr:hypothetical protein [Gammaproteobacteria bacterium]
MSKVKLHEAVIEAEIRDSVTGDVLASVYDQRGDHGDKKAYASWEEVEALLGSYAVRLKCNLDNAPSGTRCAQGLHCDRGLQVRVTASVEPFTRQPP